MMILGPTFQFGSGIPPYYLCIRTSVLQWGSPVRSSAKLKPEAPLSVTLWNVNVYAVQSDQFRSSAEPDSCDCRTEGQFASSSAAVLPTLLWWANCRTGESAFHPPKRETSKGVPPAALDTQRWEGLRERTWLRTSQMNTEQRGWRRHRPHESPRTVTPRTCKRPTTFVGSELVSTGMRGEVLRASGPGETQR